VNHDSILAVISVAFGQFFYTFASDQVSFNSLAEWEGPSQVKSSSL